MANFIDITASPFNAVAGAPHQREAIQAAFDAAHAAGVPVFIPPGDFFVEQSGSNPWSLRVPGDNFTVFGVYGRSFLKHPQGMPASAIALLRYVFANVTVRELGFDGNWGNSVGGTNSQAGLNHATQSDPKNYGIWNYKGGANDVIIERCVFRQIYGDAVWFGGTQGEGGAKNGTVRDCVIDMTARNGITISVRAELIKLLNNKITNTYTTAIDMEPQGDFAYVKDVLVEGNYLGTWWAETSTIKNTLAIDGGGLLSGGPSNWIRSVFVRGNKIHGNVIINSGVGVCLADNEIVCDYTDGYPPVLFGFFGEDVQIINNRIWDRAASNAPYLGSITLANYAYATGKDLRPGTTRVAGNIIHTRNPLRSGIHVESTGGTPGSTGTATNVTVESAQVPAMVTHSGAGWAVNAFAGHIIEMGGALATIVSNTSDTLTLSWAAWTDHNGIAVASPSAGAYAIHPTGGVVDVVENKITCSNRDGTGNGARGIVVKAGRAGMRVRIDSNEIRGATGDGIFIQPSGTAAYAFKLLQITRNFVWDDQPVPTCTTAIRFASSGNLGRMLMGDNSKSDEVLAMLAGLTTGHWVIRDGDTQDLVGFGTPEGTVAAPPGSRYVDKNGGVTPGFPTTYTKEVGNATTGWMAQV